MDSTEVDLPEPRHRLRLVIRSNSLDALIKRQLSEIAATLKNPLRASWSVLCRSIALMGLPLPMIIQLLFGDLDRGFAASAPLQPTNENYGVGIATGAACRQGGVPKTHIVMRGDMAITSLMMMKLSGALHFTS